MSENSEIRKPQRFWEPFGWKATFASTAFGSCVPGLLILLIANGLSLFKKRGANFEKLRLPALNFWFNRLFIAFVCIIFVAGAASPKPGIALPLAMAFGLMIWVFIFKSQSLGYHRTLFQENHLAVLTVASVLAWIIALIRLYFFDHTLPFHAENVFSGINGFGTTIILVSGLVLSYLWHRGGRWRLFFIPYFGLTGWTLFANQSRGAWLGFVVMLGAFSAIRRKFIIIMLIILILAGLIFSFSPTYRDRLFSSFSLEHSTNAERIFMWGVTFKMIRDHWPIGIGAGVYPYVYEKYVGPGVEKKYHNMQYSHNLFLEVAVEFGFLGLAVFLAIIGIVITMAYSLAKTGQVVYQAMFAVLIGVLVNQMFDIPIWGIDIGGSFWMLVGIIAGSHHYEAVKTPVLPE